MRDALIRWVPPTERESGLPMSPSEILHTSVGLSADGGQNFTHIDNVGGTDPQEVAVEQLENGAWIVRFEVTDTDNRTGEPFDHSFVSDDSAPGQVTDVEVILS